MVGGIRLMTYESRVTRNCGASGQGASVVAAPPVLPRASSTRVRAPDLARYAAATSPLCPAPTTMASYWLTLPPSRALRWLREAGPRHRDTATAPGAPYAAFGPVPAACRLPSASASTTLASASLAGASHGRAGGAPDGSAGGWSSAPGHRNGAWGALCGV